MANPSRTPPRPPFFWCNKHKKVESDGLDTADCLLVGPFKTFAEASAWSAEPQAKDAGNAVPTQVEPAASAPTDTKDVSTMTRDEFVQLLHQQAGVAYLVCDPLVAQALSESLSHAANLLAVSASAPPSEHPLANEIRDAIRAVAIEECAKLIEPEGPAPCGCLGPDAGYGGCDCGNVGDTQQEEAYWSSKGDAKRIRALKNGAAPQPLDPSGVVPQGATTAVAAPLGDKPSEEAIVELALSLGATVADHVARERVLQWLSRYAQSATLPHVVFDNLPYLENLILPLGHESGLMREHPYPCTGHDFCLMRQAQKGADAIRAALAATSTRSEK